MNEIPENVVGPIQQIQSLNVWARGDQRAPHKPLLVLMALASIQRGEPRFIPYEDIHTKLEQLLIDFGPQRQSYHPEYPFWRLQNDGTFWEVPERDAVEEAYDGELPHNISPIILRQVNATAGFSQVVSELFEEDPSLIENVAAGLLVGHFPSSMHRSLLEAVGMTVTFALTQRNPEFRENILRLYERSCAFCEFNGRLGNTDLALEAAHIKWHAAGGPDEPNNGLLLCSIHHKALDRGAIGITQDRHIQVSQDLHGGEQVHELIVRLNGRPLRSPLDPEASPHEDFIAWHQREVFREPARVV